VRFDEDDRCRCPECRLKFHTEMAAWAREQLTQEEEPEASLMQFYKTKVAKGPARKRKTGKSNGQETKGKDQGEGKDKATTSYPRGFMPWSGVIKAVAARSFMDTHSVKQMTDALRLVAEEEILAGRAFHFRGLCSLKLVTGARVEASAAQGRAFDAISVLGLAKLEE
jgi:hypothetical protein